MKNFILLFSFVSIFTNAQINRFFYEYKYIPDTTDPSNVKKEMMLLDVDKKGSDYYSHEKYISDSILNATLEKQMQAALSSGNFNFNTQNIKEGGEVSFRVTKQYPNYETHLFQSVGSERYKILAETKPKWNILPNKEKIGEYNTQKATASFGGREWTAWFTTDIPIQDGPYKFSGLPGLVVKVEDAQKQHVMTLVGNKITKEISKEEMQKTDLPSNIKMTKIGDEEIEVTEAKFKKVWKDYLNDPAKSLRQRMSSIGGSSGNSNTLTIIAGKDGKPLGNNDQALREIEKRERENLKKNNNPIEPDLFK